MLKMIYMHFIVLIAPKDLIQFMVVYHGKRVGIEHTKFKDISVFDFLVKVDEDEK